MQAWLEVVMAMPMYIRSCSENVKSGKVNQRHRSVKCCARLRLRLTLTFVQVLLELTDEDLELGLGVSNLMHRRKLRLAIEDYRDAENGGG